MNNYVINFAGNPIYVSKGKIGYEVTYNDIYLNNDYPKIR